MYLECPEMNAGTYYVMLMVNGPAGFDLDLKFFYYKKLRGQLTNVDFKLCHPKEVSLEPFLKSVLGDFSSKAKRSTIRELNASESSLQFD